MSLPRFYCPFALDAGARTSLPPAAAHHAARVLRLNPGDNLILFNGTGGEYRARIIRIGPAGDEVSAEVLEWAAREVEPPLPVLLAQAISGGEKMDYTLQKAVELGVARIQPLQSERSVVRLSGERAQKRVQHWQQVAIAACEQCGRNRIPEVAPIKPLASWLAEDHAPGLKLMLSPQAASRLRDLPQPETGVILLAGPEGGFSAREIEMAKTREFIQARLGPRVLRTETAALAALAAIQSLWGDF